MCLVFFSFFGLACLGETRKELIQYFLVYCIRQNYKLLFMCMHKSPFGGFVV